MPAVIVGLCLSYTDLFGQRALLEIQPGAVGMGADQPHTFREGFSPPPYGKQRLAVQRPVSPAFFHAGTESGGAEALFCMADCFTLGFAARDEIHIALGQGAHGLAFFRGSVNFPCRTVFMGKFFHQKFPYGLKVPLRGKSSVDKTAKPLKSLFRTLSPQEWAIRTAAVRWPRSQSADGATVD